MKYAIGPRKELAQRTVFNILGPLTNPAGAKRLLVGTFTKRICTPMAEVLGLLGAEHAMVVHADDGLDEISLATRTHVSEYRNGEVKEYSIIPEDCGVSSQSLIGLEVSSPEQSAELIRDALGKQKRPEASKAADMIALNAGAGLYVSGLASDLKQGVALASDLIASGLALEKIDALASFNECVAS